MSNSNSNLNGRENTLVEFYRASGFLLNYLCRREKFFRITEEYYSLKGAGGYPVDLKEIVQTYCRILEWTNLLPLKDERIRKSLQVVFNTVKNDLNNPTPEEYIRKYMTVYTMSSAVGAA